MNILLTILTTIFCGLCFAVFSVTGECRSTIVRNVRRANGGFSWNRLRRELSAFGNYVAGLSVPLVLSLPAGIVVADYVHTRIMPLNQVAAAVQNLAASGGQATGDLRTLRKQHTQWMLWSTPATDDEVYRLQRSLWFGWPMLATSGVTLVFLFGWLALGFSKVTVREYVRGICHRRDMYGRLDMQAMVATAAQSMP